MVYLRGKINTPILAFIAKVGGWLHTDKNGFP